MAINQKQKFLLRAIFQRYFALIKELDIKERGIVFDDINHSSIEDDLKSIKAFKVILDNIKMHIKHDIMNIASTYDAVEKENYLRQIREQKECLEQLNLWDPELVTLFEIISHPAPQNRSSSAPELEGTSIEELENEGYVAYGHTNEQGETIYYKERKGLLTLSSRNNNSVDPITRHDVLRFLNNTVNDIVTDLYDIVIGKIKEEKDIVVAKKVERAEAKETEQETMCSKVMTVGKFICGVTAAMVVSASMGIVSGAEMYELTRSQ